MLIDAGLSAREINRRLSLAGRQLTDVCAVCVSHEHSDHCRGLRALHLRYGLPVYVNEPTATALEQIAGYGNMTWTIFRSEEPFAIGNLVIDPLMVSHDASEPVGFVVSDHSGKRAGIVTDLGMVSGTLRSRLATCDVIILESNHDADRLRTCGRPPRLKQRIAGRQGHLCNTMAAELLADLSGGCLQTVFLAHLSLECNTPELAIGELKRVFRDRSCALPDFRLTYYDRISDVVCW